MKSIIQVMRREFGAIFKNKRLLLVIGVVPIFYTCLFGYLYSLHIVKDIRTAVIDESRTQLSRSIIEAFDQSDRFSLVASLKSEAELKTLIEEGTVDAALVIPADLTEKVLRGEEAPVLVIVNGSNMIISNSVTTNALQIIQTLSTGIAARKVQAGGGVTPDQAVNQVNPLSFRIRTWYNPSYNYTNFLLLGLTATAVQQVTMLYVAVCMCREKEVGTLPELQAMAGNSMQKLLGKGLPYVLLSLGTLTVSLLTARYAFSVPFRGSLPALLLLTAVFLASIVSLGVFLSLICRNELEATQVAMLIAVPSFLFSGYTWPLEAMPLPCMVLARILPLTYFAPALRKIAVMGLGLRDIWPELGVLLLMAVALFLLAVIVYRLKYENCPGGTGEAQITGKDVSR